jgi:hypothetical protein
LAPFTCLRGLSPANVEPEKTGEMRPVNIRRADNAKLNLCLINIDLFLRANYYRGSL